MGSVLKALGAVAGFAVLIPVSIVIALLAVIAIYFRAWMVATEELLEAASDWLEEKWPW